MIANAVLVPGVERTGPRTVSYDAPDYRAAYQVIRFVALLGRLIGRLTAGSDSGGLSLGSRPGGRVANAGSPDALDWATPRRGRPTWLRDRRGGRLPAPTIAAPLDHRSPGHETTSETEPAGSSWQPYVRHRHSGAVAVPELHIVAEPRTEFGKGASRRLRRADKVPGVVYGHGTDPRHVSLPGHDLMKALKTANVLLDLDVEGDDMLVLPKSVQRDPIKLDPRARRPGHRPARREGHRRRRHPRQGRDRSGGMLDQQMVTLSVEAEATSIPTRLEVSVEGMTIGGAIHAKDVELPEGTDARDRPRRARAAHPGGADRRADRRRAGRGRGRGRDRAHVPDAQSLPTLLPRPTREADGDATATRAHRAEPRTRASERDRLARGPAWSRWFALRGKIETGNESRRSWASRGWWSASATQVRPRRTTGTTSAPWSSTSWRAPRRRLQGAQGSSRHRDCVGRGERVMLVKPRSYMNLSGGPTAAVRDFHKGRSTELSSSTTSSTCRSARSASSSAAVTAVTTACDREPPSATGTPGTGRDRPPARPDGSGRVRAAGLRRPPATDLTRSRAGRGCGREPPDSWPRLAQNASTGIARHDIRLRGSAFRRAPPLLAT